MLTLAQIDHVDFGLRTPASHRASVCRRGSARHQRPEEPDRSFLTRNGCSELILDGVLHRAGLDFRRPCRQHVLGDWRNGGRWSGVRVVILLAFYFFPFSGFSFFPWWDYKVTSV